MVAEAWELISSGFGTSKVADSGICAQRAAGLKCVRIRNHLHTRTNSAPRAVAETLDELTGRIRTWEAQDDRPRINDRVHTIGQDFATEQQMRWFAADTRHDSCR
jgi:hypothetical protein